MDFGFYLLPFYLDSTRKIDHFKISLPLDNMCLSHISHDCNTILCNAVGSTWRLLFGRTFGKCIERLRKGMRSCDQSKTSIVIIDHIWSPTVTHCAPTLYRSIKDSLKATTAGASSCDFLHVYGQPNQNRGLTPLP